MAFLDVLFYHDMDRPIALPGHTLLGPMFLQDIDHVFRIIVQPGHKYTHSKIQRAIIYSGRQWCGTATAEWDSFKNHLKMIRIPRNSELFFHGLT